MKYLLILLFLTGCVPENEKRTNDSTYIKSECIGTKKLGDICKFTTRNGHSTCVARDNTHFAHSIECDFYDNMLKEPK